MLLHCHCQLAWVTVKKWAAKTGLLKPPSLFKKHSSREAFDLLMIRRVESFPVFQHRRAYILIETKLEYKGLHLHLTLL